MVHSAHDASARAADGDGDPDATPLFLSGQGGYHTYRIPALAVTVRGAVLAFCEGRRHGPGDAGEIDLLMRRSPDGGRTWGPPQVVVSEPGMTCGNPCPVVDRATGIIWLPFCMNNADGGEPLIVQGLAPRTVWVTHSSDDGRSWAPPQEITQDVKDPSWTWYATGPGHGVQTRSGRLVIPCDHIRRAEDGPVTPHLYHAHVIYSDDAGASWRIGGIVDEGTNECAVVEAAGEGLYINCRNYMGGRRRAFAWSYDAGETFTRGGLDTALLEPICQASLVRLTSEARHGRNRVLFCNPASLEREQLTVRVSYDECNTWTFCHVLWPGPSAYSDLAVTDDLAILCLYERGASHPYEELALSRLSLECITGGFDWV